MSAPKVLTFIGLLVVVLFAVAVSVGISKRNEPVSFKDDFVQDVRDTISKAGAYKSSHVPVGLQCFVGNEFRVQGTCEVLIPKKVRRIRLQVLEGEPRGTLTQEKGRLGYEVIPYDIEAKDNAIAVDMNGDGGRLTFTCPVLCRMVIIE